MFKDEDFLRIETYFQTLHIAKKIALPISLGIVFQNMTHWFCDVSHIDTTPVNKQTNKHERQQQ